MTDFNTAHGRKDRVSLYHNVQDDVPAEVTITK